MKEAPTLIDHLYRSSFRNERVGGWRSNAGMRSVLEAARKFVLDEDMSAFLGDLATAAFVSGDLQPVHTAPMGSIRKVEQLRVQARLPHKATWIEYDLRASLARSNQLMGKPFDPGQVPAREGWLLQQHPALENAFTLHIFTRDPGAPDHLGFDCWTFPVAFGWTVDGSVAPWRSVLKGSGSTPDATIATGILGYDSDSVAVIASDLLMPLETYKASAVTGLLREWVGVVRRAWALLATINDIPILHREVVQSKGFVAKGRYRKYLAHTTITLHVPEKKDLHKLAREVVAMARRRAHEVRGHHRIDWRNRPSALCSHDWQSRDGGLECAMCHGKKLWIREHVRGDASLGFATHQFNVTHETGAER